MKKILACTGNRLHIFTVTQHRTIVFTTLDPAIYAKLISLVTSLADLTGLFKIFLFQLTHPIRSADHMERE